jgi:hypothetical protein
MGGAVDVGVVALVEQREAVDDGLRFLRGRGIVEPHEWAPRMGKSRRMTCGSKARTPEIAGAGVPSAVTCW